MSLISIAGYKSVIKVIKSAETLDQLRDIGSRMNTNGASFRPANEAKKIANAFRRRQRQLMERTP